MRHKKNRPMLGRDSSHRRCLFANMLKSLVEDEQIVTTVGKAKFLKVYADKLITLAKKNNVAARRKAVAQLMIRNNPLTSKQARAAKAGDISAYNADRRAIKKLFEILAPRFAGRNGGYTQVIRMNRRVGDNAPTCVIKYIQE